MADHGPDTSFAAERTLLSWNRTGLSMLVTGGALVRLLPPHVPPLLRGAVAGALATAGLGALVYGFERFRVHALSAADHPPKVAAAAMALVIGVACLAGIAVAMHG